MCKRRQSVESARDDEASAFGGSAVANGRSASAIGHQSLAGALRSTAIGVAAEASERSASAFGDDSTASGIQSTAIGFSSSSSGNSSTAIGRQAQATGTGATAIGRDANASGTNAFAGGIGARAEGPRSTAIGLFSQATGTRSLALGESATATPNFSTAIGFNAVAGSNNNIAIGNSDANYTMAGLAGFGLRLLLVRPDGTLVTGPVAPPPPPSAAREARVNSTANGVFVASDKTADISVFTTPQNLGNSESDLSARISELFAMAEAAENERLSLSQRVEELEQQLASSRSALRVVHRALPALSAKILEDVGLESYKANELVDLNESLERTALELQHTATREGWLLTDKYHNASARLQTLENPIRQAMDDDAYAEYLRAIDQPLRVVVDSVMSGSAAFKAGLQPGDDIQNYAGVRVFATAELQLLSTLGQRSDVVEITILRDGELLQLSIERGPLGLKAVDAFTGSIQTASGALNSTTL